MNCSGRRSFTQEELLQKVPEVLKDYAGKIFKGRVFPGHPPRDADPSPQPGGILPRRWSRPSRQGKKVAIADVAFVNGSDLILGSQLIQHPEIARLAAYGGWNTAGNTLGTVLAQAAIYLAAKNQDCTPEQQKAHLEFLFLRFLDDYCYQAVERSLCMLEDLPAYGLLPTEERLPDGEIANEIGKEGVRAARETSQPSWKKYSGSQVGQRRSRISNLHLPWQRLFEIGFDVKVELP